MTNLSIDAIAKNIDIHNAKRMDGVRVNGTAPAGSVIAVIWGAARKFVTVNATGSWSALFAANEWPTDPGLGTISANTISGNPGATTLRTSKALPFDMTGAMASRLDTQVADGKINAALKTAVPSIKGMPPSDAGMHGTSEASNSSGSTDGHGAAQVTTASADAHASGPAPMVVARPADAAGRAATPAAGAVATYAAVSTSAVPTAETRASTSDTLRLLTAKDDVAGHSWTVSASQAVRISSATRGDATHAAFIDTNLTYELTLEGSFKCDLPTDAATQQLFHVTSMELFLRAGKLITWSRDGGGEIAVAGFTPDKAWHHYALATDGGGNWQVYVDGVLKQSRTGGRTSSNVDEHWGIMVGNHYAAANSFVGLVANVQVWDSQRSAAQITEDLIGVSSGNSDLRGAWVAGDWGPSAGPAKMTLRSGIQYADIDRTYLSNDTSQTLTGDFRGTMNSGDTLGVYDGSYLLGTAAISGASWQYTTPTLADGLHTLTAQVRDASGNTRWVSSKYSVNIDSYAWSTIDTVAGNNVVNAAEKAAGVTISGVTEANGSVEVSWGKVTKTAKANSWGNWSTAFASTEIPADTEKSTFTVKATDVAGNVSTETGTVMVDTSIPIMPLINAVSGDNTINAVEKAAGVTVSGISDPYTSVDVVWGSSTKLINVNSTGLWTTVFASDSIPSDGKKTPIMASARDYAGNVTATAVRSVTIDTAAPTAPKINAVSSDNRVNAAEKAAGVTVSGTADANNQIEVKWGSSTRIVSANESGIWTTVFSASEIPADSERTVMTAKATNPVGNISALNTSSVAVDTTMPYDPVIFRVSGDDRISLSEKNAGVTLNGTAEANGNVEVKWGTTTKSSKVNPAGFWSLKFESSEIPVDPVASTITVKSSDAAGNISAASRNVIYGTSPIINLVSGDDRINAAEKKSGVVVNGAAESNSNLEVSLGHQYQDHQGKRHR
ncbi:Ig-like domain-containing protein [Leptothrix sp. BB-4]